MKFLETKPQLKNINSKYFDLFYTVIKNRNDKEIEDDKYENKEVEYINLKDFIPPNHYIGRKNNNEILW